MHNFQSSLVYYRRHFKTACTVRNCNQLSNSNTKGRPPVRGDNLRALASGLSSVQVDKHVIIFYTTYISVDLANREIFIAKVGEGGIIMFMLLCNTNPFEIHFSSDMRISVWLCTTKRLRPAYCLSMATTLYSLIYNNFAVLFRK